MKIKQLLIFLMLLSLRQVSPVSPAQKLPSGPQVLTFFSDIDDSEQPYGLYLPKNFNPAKKYPFVMMLHGAGSNHRLDLKRVFGKTNAPGETDVETSRYFPELKDVDYIVAAPLARGTLGYQGITEKDVMDVLADVKKRFLIDEDRTYLTGLSMGGGGTLWIGLTHPDIWAAIAPVCPAPPAGTIELAPNALNFPVHFFHGDADPVVPIAGTREWVKKLKESGTNVESIEYPGVQHNSWENAYKDASIFDWFGKFRRNRFPDQVRFNTTQYKHNSAYWVRLDEFTPGTLAGIDAKFTTGNDLNISASHLNAFTLNLAGHPKFNAGSGLQLTINGEKLKAKSSDTYSFSNKNGKWEQINFQASVSSKRPGAEGPVNEAFASRHVYVYGTAGNPSAEELRNRAEIANKAANWSSTKDFNGRSIFLFPRVVADKDLRASDLEGANLILFGTAETNLIIQKYSDRLPVELKSAATGEYGLVYTFPVDGHYVVVSSGLPYWSGFEVQGLASLYPIQASSIAFLKDFLLFRNSQKTKVLEGNFDNNWKLNSADAKAMTDSGVLNVK
ncbi:prolyl oligopeptidase family serine peptidase [Pseudarcicella hirudinis]|nr:prolyl oligopeptidase family serine peptidase [Pseudarcicella hirudinis]